MQSERPLAAIDVSTLESGLVPAVRERICSLEHFAEIDSTNRHLLEQPPPPPGSARVALSEFQSSGRGRRGREWTMPAGSGVALSCAWQFATAPQSLAALSLAVGAVSRRAVGMVTGLWADLKWPNDLLVADGKLGGILVELGTLETGCLVVAGIGINVDVPPDVLAGVAGSGSVARDLAGAAPDWEADRAALAAGLINQLIELFAAYPASGFEPYRAEWQAAHMLHDRPVELQATSGTSAGTVRGIDADGALLIESATGQIRRIISGDVTVRGMLRVRD